MAKTLRISANYWNSLREFERSYIQDRYYNSHDDLPTLKSRIADARKYHPDFTAIEGKGFITTPSGIFLHSGSDTRNFHPFN